MSDVSEWVGPDTDMDIFDFRWESTHRNLEAMNSFVKKLKDRNKRVKEMRGKLVDKNWEIGRKLDSLTADLKAIQQYAGYDSVDPDDIKAAAAEASRHLTQLTALFNAARENATGLTVLHLEETALDPSDVELQKRIGNTRLKLASIKQPALGSEIKDWKQLKDTGTLWAEYLDYLAGLSLRHDGLDEGVCDIADAMIRELKSSSSSLEALAIPGREGCSGTLPKIVYLRFPEWTIWALPFAAYELWVIAEASAAISTMFLAGYTRRLEVKGQNELISPYEEWMGGLDESKAERKRKLTHYLADAFATYTMGPAYAWSSLLLGLDPTHPHDQLRAQTILRILDRLNMPNRPKTFADDQALLANLWDRALRQTDKAPESIPESIVRWIDSLFAHLATIPMLRFPTDEWEPRREKWARDLREGTHASEDPQMSIRFALNAAWAARVASPHEAKAIAQHCYSLCKVLEKRPVTAPAGPVDEVLNSF